MNENASRLVLVAQEYAGTSSSTLVHVYHPSTSWPAENDEKRMRYVTLAFVPGYGVYLSSNLRA